MKKEERDHLLGWSFYILTLVVFFGIVVFIGHEKHDNDQDLKLVKVGDLVMCTVEKSSNNDKVVLHIIEAMSVDENAVEDKELRGWILNNDAITHGIGKYEDIKNCEGELMFAEAGSEEARDLTAGITTKGLPLEVIYNNFSPPLRRF